MSLIKRFKLVPRGIHYAWNKEGRLTRLACIILILLAIGLIGFVLAEDAADEEMVDNGTMDLVTTVHGYVYTADQSVAGTGFANIHSNLGSVNPDDGSQVLNLKVLDSGSGYYSHNSSITVMNNVARKDEKALISPEEEFEGSDQNITAKEDTSAVYSEMNFQIPGSFRVKAIRSLWKDQTCAKNYAGMISMNSLFDYAKTLNKESTTIMHSDLYENEENLDTSSSNIGSSMDINSQFDGVAHLGATINDVRGGDFGIMEPKAKSNSAVLMDEDYKGSFYISKKMATEIDQITNYGDLDTDIIPYDYPWLPCACNAGWDDMAIHDTKYHSAKDFFDCTTCWPPAPCKN
jgi:hypothetical protein